MLPAALGRAIRQLEDGLGVARFERTTRSVAVTPEGGRILGEARRLLDAADGMTDPRVLALSLVCFGTSAGLYTLGIWAPARSRRPRPKSPSPSKSKGRTR